MKLKLKINESVSDIKEVILQKLPDLDLDWEIVENENGKQFSTEIGDFQIIVKEDSVLLSVISESEEGLTENVKNLTHIQDPTSNKKIKSMLYGRLCKRFESHSEITYYKKILESILLHENVENESENPNHI